MYRLAFRMQPDYRVLPVISLRPAKNLIRIEVQPAV